MCQEDHNPDVVLSHWDRGVWAQVGPETQEFHQSVLFIRCQLVTEVWELPSHMPKSLHSAGGSKALLGADWQSFHGMEETPQWESSTQYPATQQAVESKVALIIWVRSLCLPFKELNDLMLDSEPSIMLLIACFEFRLGKPTCPMAFMTTFHCLLEEAIGVFSHIATQLELVTGNLIQLTVESTPKGNGALVGDHSKWLRP